MNPFVEVLNLTKHFKRGNSIIKAVDRITFNLSEGEILCLVGPNGAGKTTLLKILATLISPKNGTVLINGLCLEKDDLKIKKIVGLYTAEERSFYWRLTGRQNLEFYASLYNLPYQTTRERINELCKIFQIDEPDRKFAEYSTGIKLRFGLARALLNSPKLLLLDEPTKSLDPLMAEVIRKLIKNRFSTAGKTTIIFTTHNLEEAVNLADVIAELKEGRLATFKKNEKRF